MLVGRYGAVLDACVLHPAILRGALLWLAQERLFRPIWSEAILDEWQTSLSRRFPDLGPDKLARMRSGFDAFDAALVAVPGTFVRVAELPDPNDAHVFAAALAGKANAIVTFNMKHFPEALAAEVGLEIRHPDDFIVNILDLDETKALGALRTQRASYANPSITAQAFLDKLERMGLVQTRHRLAPLVALL